MTLNISDQGQKRMFDTAEHYLVNESLERTLQVIHSFENAFIKITESYGLCRKF